MKVDKKAIIRKFLEIIGFYQCSLQGYVAYLGNGQLYTGLVSLSGILLFQTSLFLFPCSVSHMSLRRTHNLVI